MSPEQAAAMKKVMYCIMDAKRKVGPQAKEQEFQEQVKADCFELASEMLRLQREQRQPTPGTTEAPAATDASK